MCKKSCVNCVHSSVCKVMDKIQKSSGTVKVEVEGTTVISNIAVDNCYCKDFATRECEEKKYDKFLSGDSDKKDYSVDKLGKAYEEDNEEKDCHGCNSCDEGMVFPVLSAVVSAMHECIEENNVIPRTIFLHPETAKKLAEEVYIHDCKCEKLTQSKDFTIFECPLGKVEIVTDSDLPEEGILVGGESNAN